MKLTEQKREDILNGAVEEFSEHGYTAARTSRIAQRAGVSSRTLYKHFEGKEALFGAIMERFFKRINSEAQTILDEKKDLREQMIEVVEHYIEAISDEQLLSMNRIGMAEFLRDRDLAERVFEKKSCFINPIHSLIVQAMDRGLIRRDDSRYAVEKLVSLLEGFFFLPLLLLGKYRQTERSPGLVIADCVDMFLSQYRLD